MLTAELTRFRRELGVLTGLAAPLAVAQLAQMAMGVIDTVMAGRLSSVDLAGVALGGTLLWPTIMLMMGTLQAVTPSVSQLNGGGRQAEIGEIIRQAFYLALVAAVIIVTVIQFARPYFELVGIEPAAVDVAVGYLEAQQWGAPAAMGYFVLRYMAEGMGQTRVALYIVTGALIMKVPLNLAFMHGYYGLPAMGGAGTGAATAVVLWYQLAAIGFIVTRSRFASARLTERFSPPDPRVLKALLAIGIPIGITLFFEVTMFSFTTLLVGRYGSEVVAAHVIAMNLGGVAFMVPMAFGMAGTIRVGFNVGAGEFARARLTAIAELCCAFGLACIIAVLIVIFREDIAGIYTREPEVIALATTLMFFVLGFQFFDGLQSIAIATLRGYKDTKVAMYATMFGYWGVGVPVACILGWGLVGEPMDVYGFWIGLTVGLGVVAALMTTRLLRISGRVARQGMPEIATEN
jgi:MATE family multidrug resistance protein